MPSESTNTRIRRAEPLKNCTKAKPFVKNAFNKCSTATNSCIVQCFKNYQFTNGRESVKLLCNAGEWIMEGFQKTDKPACERRNRSRILYFNQIFTCNFYLL